MPRSLEISEQDHIQGPDDAPVTMIEYGDFECPHCGAAYPVVKLVQQQFEDSLRFVYRHFPLSEIHPVAEPAAEASEFGARYGKFWEMHDGIFENQPRLSPSLLTWLANHNGLDPEGLEEALELGMFRERVQHDFLTGVRSGVNGTPTFFVNGHRHDGPPTLSSLAESIAAAMVRAPVR